MAHFSKRNKRKEREVQQALNNRLELVKEGFTRRDLMKMGGSLTGANNTKISLETALRYCSNPTEFELRVKGIHSTSDETWKPFEHKENLV